MLFSSKNQHNNYRFSIFSVGCPCIVCPSESMVILLWTLVLVWTLFESHIFISSNIIMVGTKIPKRFSRTTSAYRIKCGAIDGEERDLIHLRPKDSKLGAATRERKAWVTGRKLSLIENEWFFRRECESKGEPVPPLNLCIWTWIEYRVRVPCIGTNHHQHHYHNMCCHNCPPHCGKMSFWWLSDSSKRMKFRVHYGERIWNGYQKCKCSTENKMIMKFDAYKGRKSKRNMES